MKARKLWRSGVRFYYIISEVFTAIFLPDPIVEWGSGLSEDGDYILMVTPQRFLGDMKDFQVRPTDVFVITWPRSGTTWTQYMTTQIVHGPNSVNERNLHRYNYYLELFSDFFNVYSAKGMYKLAEEIASPRLLKTHFQMKFVPSKLFTVKPKSIYVARNPKDATVSYYNFTQMNLALPNYRDWSSFYEHSIRGYVPYGDWFSHVLPWWKLRNEPNVLFLKYEDAVKDIKGTVTKINTFLGTPRSPQEVDEISRKSSFEEMKKNPKANTDLFNMKVLQKSTGQKFMRKGIIGDWRNYFTPAQNIHFDEVYRVKMENTGLSFDFGQLPSAL